MHMSKSSRNEKRRRTNGEHASLMTQNNFECIDESDTPKIKRSLMHLFAAISSASSEPNHVLIVLEVEWTER